MLLGTTEGLKQLAGHLERMHYRVVRSARLTVLSGGGPDMAGIEKSVRAETPQAPSRLDIEPRRETQCEPVANCALVVRSQVNHCHVAWAAPGWQHPEAPALAVAAELISQKALHRRLREQGGAYGGSAAYFPEDGVFSMSSFRDPRLAETYEDFDAALAEIAGEEISQEELEEAIITVIKRLDKPLSPYSRAIEAVRLQQRGVTFLTRQQFRKGVLTCTATQVNVTIERWLCRGARSRAAAVGRVEQDLGGLQAIDVLALVG
jgi:Zn-dependent M16 (insulinase) family peptidase